MGARRRAACRPGPLATKVTFGYKLDQSLDGGALPSGLQTWTFGHNSNQSLRAWMVARSRATCRPGPLATKVTFGYSRAACVCIDLRPSGTSSNRARMVARRRAACRPGPLATKVTFGYKLDQSLDGGALPSSLRLGPLATTPTRVCGPGWWHAAVQPADLDLWPQRSWSFGFRFNLSFHNVMLPSSPQT